MSERRGVRFLLRGRVQGVGFRYFVERRARQLGLAGWVRNRPDGAVEGEAAGAPEDLARFTADLRRGPPGVEVESLETVELDQPPTVDGFRITH